MLASNAITGSQSSDCVRNQLRVLTLPAAHEHSRSSRASHTTSLDFQSALHPPKVLKGRVRYEEVLPRQVGVTTRHYSALLLKLPRPRTMTIIIVALVVLIIKIDQLVFQFVELILLVGLSCLVRVVRLLGQVVLL